MNKNFNELFVSIVDVSFESTEKVAYLIAEAHFASEL